MNIYIFTYILDRHIAIQWSSHNTYLRYVLPSLDVLCTLLLLNLDVSKHQQFPSICFMCIISLHTYILNTSRTACFKKKIRMDMQAL